MEKLSRRETLSLLRSAKRNSEGGRRGWLGFLGGSRSSLAWGGDKRRRE
jgi:hypothetical protein